MIHKVWSNVKVDLRKDTAAQVDKVGGYLNCMGVPHFH